MSFHHIPVLLAECIDGLAIRPDGIGYPFRCWPNHLTQGGTGGTLELQRQFVTVEEGPGGNGPTQA